MTFFAVAWDSFREATDRSISTIMVILSILIGLTALAVGFPAVPVEDLVRAAAREASYPKSARVTRVDERTVDLELARPPSDPAAAEPQRVPPPEPPGPGWPGGRRRGPPGGPFDKIVDGGEATGIAALGREDALRASEFIVRALEDRGVKRVAVGDATGPGSEGRVRLTLDYDFMKTRGGAKMSILAWSLDLEFPAHGTNMYIGSPASEVLWNLEGLVIEGVAGWGGLIVAVIATAGFVPSMVGGGTAHLLLAKPVRRATLLLGKYAGGVAFVAFHGLVLTTAIVAAVYVRTGIFEARLLFAPLSLASVFAILYAASCLAGILFETAVVSIFAAFALWILSFTVVTGHKIVHNIDQILPGRQVEIPGALETFVDVVYFVAPKTGDVAELYMTEMQKGHLSAQSQKVSEEFQRRLSTPTVIATTVGFTVLLLGVACWVFSRRDY